MATNLSSYVGTTYTQPDAQFYVYDPGSPYAPVKSGSTLTFANRDSGNFFNSEFGGGETSFKIMAATKTTLTIAFNDPSSDAGYGGTYQVLGLSNDVILMQRVIDGQLTHLAIGPANYFQSPYPDISVDTAYATDAATYTPPPQEAPPPCLAAGTRVATDRGEVAVEDVRVGDMLVRHDGGLARVVWVGQRRVSPSRHPDTAKLHPVLVAADAFAEGVPARDVFLSPDHAVFAHGVLVPVAALCNGVTIRQVTRALVTYHHVETERHDVMLAENLPVETYLDMGNRHAFEGPGMMLHPDFTSGPGMPGCAPRLGDGPEVRAIRAGLLERVVARGYAADADADVHLMVDGRRIDGIGGVFALPAGARDVRIVSRAGIPAHVSAETSDDRRLGVALAGVTVVTHAGSRDILAEDGLAQGWHHLDEGIRWTDGDAVIPASLIADADAVHLDIVATSRRWRAYDAARAA